MREVLKMENVSYHYEDDVSALKNVIFSVKEGESLAILGPNGAGKSTLLKLACGLLYPTEGTITLLGEMLSKKNAPNLRKKVGILFQDPDDQIFMPRVWDDVAFGPINLNKTRSEVEYAVNHALEATGLLGFENRVPHHLSYGEKKKVAIAGILAMEPEVIFLDEPTANLDPKGRTELMGIIRKSCDTLVCATHDINTASIMADRLLVLNKSVIAMGSARTLFSDTKTLIENNLEAPLITKLFLSLRELGYDMSLPLSEEEAIGELKKRLAK